MIYDVIVSGLGPAGSTFLKLAEEKGLKVLGIEKEKPGREKPCAGGLTSKSYHLLNSVFKNIDKVVVSKTTKLIIRNKGREIPVSSDSPIIYQTERKELDRFLMESVSSVHFEERVERVEEDEKFVRVLTSKDEYRCRIFVCCEGVASKTATLFGITKKLGATVEGKVPGSFEEAIIDFSSFRWGYFWLFPKEGTANVGAGELKNKRKLLETFEKVCNFHGLKPVSLKTFPIPCGSSKPRVLKGKVLFLGDSAGLVDPLTGEGIYYAVKSSCLAVCSVLSYFGGNEKSLFRFQEEVKKTFGKEFFWAKVVGELFFRTKDAIFNLIGEEKIVSETLLKVLSGSITYRESFFKFIKFLPPVCRRFVNASRNR